MRLPRLPAPVGLTCRTQTAFAGLERRERGADGGIGEMENLCAAHAPALATRPPRHIIAQLERPNGLCCDGRLVWVDGGSLVVDGEQVGTLSDSPKRFATLGGRLLIWPDKVVYTPQEGIKPLEAVYTAQGLRFHSGTYAGQAAQGNSITTDGEPFPFQVGDGVTISGCTRQPENNKTAIVREVSEDGRQLRFYEHTFTLPVEEAGDTEEGQTEAGQTQAGVREPEAVTLARTVPDLEMLCVHENRVWGAVGDSLWCCKLGDPTNWNVFEGLSTDAFCVQTGTPGPFTGCISFLGYPVFFKEDRVFKIYGSRPANFEVMGSATLGVLAGCGGSLAVAGESLYYLSRSGIVQYNGGTPYPVGGALGRAFRTAWAGSDGMRYYVSLDDGLYVLDTESQLWHREDGVTLVGTGWKDGLYALTGDGQVLLLGTPPVVPEGAVPEGLIGGMAQFNPIHFGQFGGKYPRYLRLRLEVARGAVFTVAVEYDSSGRWERATQTVGQGSGTRTVSIPLRRCDHLRLRLSGSGPWKLWGLEWQVYQEAGAQRN